MNVEFQCQNCSTTLRVDRQYLGRQARCPNCKTVNLVADQQDSADALRSFGGQEVPDQQVQAAKTDSESVALENLEESPRTSANLNASASETGSEGFRPNPYTSPSSRSAGWHGSPHRGGMILTLGILAATCNFLLIPGIMAWVMGSSDLKKMEAGYMDPEGKGITTAGMVLGIVFTLLILVPLVLYVLFLLFIIVMAVIAGVAGA